MPRKDWRFADETLTTVAKPAGGRTARGRSPAGEMNRVETRFARHLDLRKHVGEVLWYEFEPLKFNLGSSCFYTPDFGIMLADCTLEMVDVKGTKALTDSKGQSYDAAYYEEDARVKIAAAARRYPFAFFFAFESAGNWMLQRIPG